MQAAFECNIAKQPALFWYKITRIVQAAFGA